MKHVAIWSMFAGGAMLSLALGTAGFPQEAGTEPAGLAEAPASPEGSVPEPEDASAAEDAGNGPLMEDDAAAERAGKPLGGLPLDPLSRLTELLRGAAEEPPGTANEATEESDARIATLRSDSIRNFEKNRTPETIRNLNELVVLQPYNPFYHFALGLCYRKERQYKEALKKYQDVLDLGGPKALVALLKAEVFAVEGKKDKLFEMLREAALGGRNIINDVQHLPLLAQFASDTEFIQLALQLEKVEIDSTRRHDPFTNPFPSAEVATGTPGDAPPPDEDLLPLEPREQEKLVRDARRIYERIQFFIKLQDEDKAMAAYVKLKSYVNMKGRLTIPKYVKEFQGIISRFEHIEELIQGIRLRYYYNQAQEKIAGMKTQFENGEYVLVSESHRQIRQLTEEMVNANAKFKSVADQIDELASQWADRAQVRLEFEQRKPRIQGIVISDSENMVILNDRVVRQGDVVADFRVIDVESNKVTFRYKGEQIPLVFRRY